MNAIRRDDISMYIHSLSDDFYAYSKGINPLIHLKWLESNLSSLMDLITEEISECLKGDDE